jgi:hypothetical protein
MKYPLRYSRLSEALLRQGSLFVQHTNYSDTLMEKFIVRRIRTLPTELQLDESVTASELEDIDNEVTG